MHRILDVRGTHVWYALVRGHIGCINSGKIDSFGVVVVCGIGYGGLEW